MSASQCAEQYPTHTAFEKRFQAEVCQTLVGANAAEGRAPRTGRWTSLDLDHLSRGCRVGPKEFHPGPLTEPDLILSHHPARAIARRLPPSAELSVVSQFERQPLRAGYIPMCGTRDLILQPDLRQSMIANFARPFKGAWKNALPRNRRAQRSNTTSPSWPKRPASKFLYKTIRPRSIICGKTANRNLTVAVREGFGPLPRHIGR